MVRRRLPRSAMPAQPSTIASGPVLLQRARISASMRRRASEPASSTSAPALRPPARGQRAIRLYWSRLRSMGTIERDRVVTTLDFSAIQPRHVKRRLANAMTGAAVAHRAASGPVSSKQAMTKASACCLTYLVQQPGKRKRSSNSPRCRRDRTPDLRRRLGAGAGDRASRRADLRVIEAVVMRSMICSPIARPCNNTGAA